MPFISNLDDEEKEESAMDFFTLSKSCHLIPPSHPIPSLSTVRKNDEVGRKLLINDKIYLADTTKVDRVVGHLIGGSVVCRYMAVALVWLNWEDN